jgi:hypothetical protein
MSTADLLTLQARLADVKLLTGVSREWPPLTLAFAEQH